MLTAPEQTVPWTHQALINDGLHSNNCNRYTTRQQVMNGKISMHACRTCMRCVYFIQEILEIREYSLFIMNIQL